MSEMQKRYSTGAMWLHWILAIALAAEIALGFAMPRDASGFDLYQLHKSLGISIFVLSLLRLFWRMRFERPPQAEPGILGKFASLVHVLFYVIMIGMPLTGWIIVSTASIDVPTLLWGVVPIPHLPLPEAMNGGAEQVHELMAYAALGLFALHVVGALRHQFLLRDRLLARMSPGGNGTFAMILAGVVVFFGLLVFVRVGNVGPVAMTAEDGPAEIAEFESAPEEDLLEPEAEETEAAVAEEDAETDSAEEEASEPEPAETQAAQAPPPDWTIQPGGSLRFTVDNGGTAINGSFASWNGTIAMNPAEPSTARIRIEIDLASATLGDSTQDRMLRGEEFFAASANPTAVWRSLSVRSLGGGQFEADGTLSLKGVSRPQQIRFTLSGEGARRGVEGSASIDRGAFGVGTGENAANLAPNVRVNFTFDAVR